MANAWSIATRAAGWLGLSAALVACGNSTTQVTGAGGGGGDDGSGGSNNQGGNDVGGQGGTPGAGGEGPTNPLEFDGPLPEFSLDDVNGSSSTTGQAVNPRDYLGQISAWYFAHAT